MNERKKGIKSERNCWFNERAASYKRRKKYNGRLERFQKKTQTNAEKTQKERKQGTKTIRFDEKSLNIAYKSKCAKIFFCYNITLWV